MRLVLDTSVLVAAIRSDRGASRRLLLAALDRRFELPATAPLFLEWEAVMSRPEHLAASGLTREAVGELLDALAVVIRPAAASFRWRPAAADPDDDMVLEAAVNGGAAAIVTFNPADLASAAAGFGVEVLSPREALRRLEMWT